MYKNVPPAPPAACYNPLSSTRRVCLSFAPYKQQLPRLKRSWELAAHTQAHAHTETHIHASLHKYFFNKFAASDFWISRLLSCATLSALSAPFPSLPPLGTPCHPFLRLSTPHKHNVTKQTNKQTHTYEYRHTHRAPYAYICICTFVCIENFNLARLQIYLLLSLSLLLLASFAPSSFRCDRRSAFLRLSK